ncbi:hypothetical protein LWI28_021357 [Acer negundo]|uniref:PGG domain-containing protein n=1 Tax=Acer negundo TaxID=4023 RepID=A0AAD5JE57_ACENE|nr:hypothetical protein LWI28_021357 [Acer negundo]
MEGPRMEGPNDMASHSRITLESKKGPSTEKPNKTEFMASSFSRKVEADFIQQDHIDVFFENIYAGFYDTALGLVQHDPELAVTRYINDETALHALARKPSAYASRSRGFLRKVFNFFIGMKFTGNSDSKPNQALELLQCVWKEIMRRQDVNVADFIRKPSDLLFNAAKLGDFELLVVLLRPYPDLVGELDENLRPYPGLVGELDENLRSIFHVAVLHRRVKILKLIHEIGIDEELLAIVDKEKNSILHIAAKYWPSDDNMYGAELEMQRELLFFKEVEMMMPPSLREMKNAEDVTPRELFSIEHKRLLQRQQQHMRRAAKSFLSCVIFFALVTLGALFVIPGNINKTIPLHVKETLLQLYTASDATAFFSSCLCILMSLWIIVSSYEEIDFLLSLPLKYMVGIGALYTTLISMLVTSSTISYLALYGTSISWVPWFSLLPVPLIVTAFASTIYPELRNMFCATCNGWYLS